MKKAFVFLAALAMALLCGCGNHNAGLGNYTFKTIHICDHAGNCRDLKVKSWHDNEGPGIEVQLADGNSLFCSEGTYILVGNHCPLCEEVD